MAVWAPAAWAQGGAAPAIADSSAARIMARVGAQAGAPWLRDILRQANASYPRAKLDEIADSLVTRAINPAAVTPRREDVRAFGISHQRADPGRQQGVL